MAGGEGAVQKRKGGVNDDKGRQLAGVWNASNVATRFYLTYLSTVIHRLVTGFITCLGLHFYLVSVQSATGPTGGTWPSDK